MPDTSTPPDLEKAYSPSYYARMRPNSARSAAIIVPLVIELLQPTSVIDLGCGDGTWLSNFIKHGILDALGVDGGGSQPGMLQIPAAYFHKHDLSQPLQLERTFDLAVCLEVAEHLAITSADHLIDQLTRLAPKVLFSAAIPFQGERGDYHINEQWQEWWAERFEQRGYTTFDVLRPRIWNNPEVAWYYAQDTLIFISNDYLAQHPELPHTLSHHLPRVLNVVHPNAYLSHFRLSFLLRRLPSIIRNTLKVRQSSGQK